MSVRATHRWGDEEKRELGEGAKEKKANKNSIIAPYIYDARHHAHPYIVSTTVLTQNCQAHTFLPNAHILLAQVYLVPYIFYGNVVN